MDEGEFRRMLDLFPVVRSHDYCGDADAYQQDESTSKARDDQAREWQNAWAEVDQEDSNMEDPFWQKLKSAAKMKVGPAEAHRFCKAFQRVHEKLVSEEPGLNSIERFVDPAFCRPSKEQDRLDQTPECL